MNPKTIIIHLPSGDPTGIKIAELSNRIIRGYVLPREKLAEAKIFEELSKPALYILVSKDGEQAYIGETENFLSRISTHGSDTEKDYWDLVLVFVSKDSSLEKSDVGYLEAIAVAQAKEAAKCEIHNRTIPTKNNLHQFKVSAIEEFFEDVSILSSAFGYPVFDVLREEEIKDNDVWICTTKKTHARAVFDGGKFIILAGSKIDPNAADSWKSAFPSSLEERERIFEKSGELIDGIITLKDNVTFRSPNHAGGFAAGRNVNAWITWKNSDGKTMDEVLR
ncbi:MAG: methionine sulfoxide reductase [Candidatus Magasanikbacteria bacterium CG11_big_fil_rev_8_21_14_0_20_39_34]|uniref:Methionine sulfoxide reductase n=1 Tax=Candidatus Magasanikbacteria bacterium CG11_big_fil_rev_8_21_14_0_20_39_34 TaxID=1974653 RepID=A0A2H0N4Y3_9BACT|nr:MAG: methionine sulfoxide reductase [Candidatus Magasanikbacteria bacterium CG11_big_fil_rev_8_21_14_0_20_39_34]